MPNNRSHHFVPRCYLKGFARTDGKVIALYNIKRGTIVEHAPVKSQCARDYLYGRDELEFHLSDIEGRYAEWITRGVLSNERAIIADIEQFCRFFALIQYMRTEAHAARMRAHLTLVNTLADMPDDNELSVSKMDLSDSGLARDGIFFALEMRDRVSDLKLSFLENATNAGFVTCDDPVVQTNRLYIQKVGDTNFGLGSAGALIYLPLSPRVAVLLYDGDVYTVPKNDKYWARLRREQDVHALNDLIFLKARENLYFYDEADFSLGRIHAIADRRIVDWHRGRVLIPIGEEDGQRVYAESDEIPETGGYVVATSQQHPIPRRWPSVLRFRNPPVVYGNESGMGYVRKHTVPAEARGVVKIRADGPLASV